MCAVGGAGAGGEGGWLLQLLRGQLVHYGNLGWRRILRRGGGAVQSQQKGVGGLGCWGFCLCLVDAGIYCTLHQTASARYQTVSAVLVSALGSRRGTVVFWCAAWISSH